VDTILIQEPYGKKTIARPGRRRENYIKTDLKSLLENCNGIWW
jgi:hypothetical protein